MKMKKILQAKVVGHPANKYLEHDQEGKIVGVTSQGLFISTFENHILFVTHQLFKGPLTINVPGQLLYGSQKPGQIVRLSRNRIVFENNQSTVEIEGAQIWQAEIPQSRRRSLQESWERFQQISTQNFSEIGTLPQWEAISSLGDWFNYVQGLIGAGEGLTPVGDDIILGLVLILNRHEGKKFKFPELKRFNQQIIDLAKEQTNMLSSNLITCASSGWADERITRVCNHLLFDECLRTTDMGNLFTWGSTSGKQVWQGMGAGLSLLINMHRKYTAYSH
ncbi:MAG: DUF2877 domain-containing protein [Anaerolineaceae bacterium]|nr:DUF2877 domain-containing protein [Anaerolineaceae bacterium]